MKKKFQALTIILLFLNSMVSISSSIKMGSAIFQDPNVPNSAVNLEMNYSIDYSTNDPSMFQLWNIVIKNWTSNDSVNARYLQQNSILSNQSSPIYSSHTFDPYDVYNNTYDYYNKTMDNRDLYNSFQLEYIYDLSLEAYSWNIPQSLSLLDFDSSSAFYQQYTSPQPFCESTDAEVVAKAQDLVGSESSIVNIAQKIFLFLCAEMDYIILDDAIGAKAALQTMQGDCSEFSSLMVALLRASGIPARKVLGFVLIDGNLTNALPKNDIEVGDKWSYSYSDQNIPGHAWVQYYIPNYGWVSADPTWGHSNYVNGEQAALTYFNAIDCIHIITSVGDFYGEGIEPELYLFEEDPTGLAEFPFVYPIGNASRYDFNLQISFHAINVTKPIVNDFTLLGNLLYLVSTSSVILVIVFIVYSKRKKKNDIRHKYKNI